MHIYEVVARDAPAQKHVVVARSEENAIKTLIFELNEEKGFNLFITDDFVVQSSIDPNDYEETEVLN